MSIYYYGGPENKPLGPFNDEEIRKLADEGAINDDTLVRSEGQTKWVRFADWKAAEGSCYYAGPDKKPLGPYSAKEMRKLADEGKIRDDTFVISEGQTNWVRFADWKAAHETPEAAEAVARNPEEMRTGTAKLDWAAFIFGLLLVLVEIFVLPGRLLHGAAMTLANWGRKRKLPSTQSHLPVATFFTVVFRPACHILCTVVVAIIVCVVSCDKATRGSGGLLSLPEIFIIGFVVLFFGNLLIGAIFDTISVGIVIANSLRNIERK